ncbi:gliding motility-associated C-terminal domain-containing protein [Dyadobacter koreensis]|uniref:Gliding motility-associated C-terminal domain-containing protein n=1 Tax=Dyadobacter koreensis TaxID=408657 RepID=A0A1H6W5H6_9BACT|nr:gliding motility-associated C-terminal domain-containing protein [Dyadobacter koreensis]SEJ12291.1 gliding motility-associated C-terminal domain-containing protein [Dyadobacter koreensis]
MRNNLQFQVLLLLLICFAFGNRAYATHARAGEITAKRVPNNPLAYDVTFTGYFDVSPNGIGAAEAQKFVLMYFYNGASGTNAAPTQVDRIDALTRNIGNNTTQNIYTTRYVFPSAGNWSISVSIDNRNVNILNLSPVPTDRLNFYVHTNIVINSFVGVNQTPVLLNAPIDIAAVGQRYIHNPGAFDADGDSIAYRLYTPQQGTSRGLGENLGYKNPNLVTPPGTTETGQTPATFSMNSLTGDLIWDAPVTKGLYNVAFVVEEWRDGVKIGEIIRDMQIIVEDARNDRPKLDPIDELCVEAGTLINQTIRATDKNGDKLTLTSTSGVYQATPLISPAYATFTVPQQGAQSTITGQFRWQTGCNHVRLEPYEVLFKVEDGPATGTPNPSLFRKLVDFTTFNIRVYGPPPQNLRAVPVADAAGKAFRVTWDTYKCPVPGARIVIYRREGCRVIPIDVCQPGLPAGSGYEEIARVGIGETFYVDNNNNTGLESGISYSYRIVVEFPRPGSDINEPGYLVGGGESIVSDQVCIEVPLIMPVITNVTVDETNETNGQITVKWTRPTLQEGASVPAQYKLFRATGLNGTAFTNIATINTNLSANAADTVYVDRGLNTVANAYNYKIEYYYTEAGSLVKLDETETASSVRLSQGQANPTSIRLNWTANVPWSNDNQVHRVYREDKSRPGTFNRIADVTVQGPQSYTFTDDGSDKYAADGTVSISIVKDSVYCYKVETVGSYNNTQIKADPLYNFSQIICLSASDTTKPCVPVLSIDELNCAEVNRDTYCGQTSFTNNLSWAYPQNAECDQNIIAYRLYYTRFEGDTPTLLKEIAAPASTSFAHEGMTSFAGCYYVTAVNKYGTESVPSNTVCKDNCPIIELPNVITPNGDGKNDTFKPLDCPSFVQAVEFKIFNRWGAKVFETNDVNINWDGKNNSGNELAAGQYYYELTVYFESVQREGKPAQFKGWVQVLR